MIHAEAANAAHAATAAHAAPAHRRVTRGQAAAILRAARNAFRKSPAEAGEAIGWALTVMRESIAARRLKIDFLLHVSNYESADAMIARSLMQGYDRPLMRLRFAQSLLAQGRLQQADAEIRRVIKARPDHAGALTVAAEVEMALSRSTRAIVLLMHACELRPSDLTLRNKLVQALLDANWIEFAAAQVDGFPSIAPLLRARVLRAQGRLLEAIELLENHIGNLPLDAVSERSDAMCELIDGLDKAGDAPRLRFLLGHMVLDSAEVRERAARALLALGDFDRVLELSDAAETWRAENAAIKAVASAISEAPFDLSSASDHGSENRTQLAELWLRAMLGRIVANRMQPREIGCDPSVSVLQPMIHAALRTIDAAIAHDEKENGDDAMLLRHRQACLHAIGRAQHAAEPASTAAANDAASEKRIERAFASRRAA